MLWCRATYKVGEKGYEVFFKKRTTLWVGENEKRFIVRPIIDRCVWKPVHGQKNRKGEPQYPRRR